MDDFGGQLKQAREQRGISLRQIATATKISAAALEALERNDFSRLPGGIFSRAFVRAYAVEVGIDPEQTVQDFLVEFDRRGDMAAEMAPPEVTPDDRAFLERQRRAARWLRAVLIAIVVAAVAGFVGWQLTRVRTQASVEPAATSGGAQASAEPVAPQPSVAPPAVPPTLAGMADAGTEATATPAPSVNGSANAAAKAPDADRVEVHLQVSDDCWVRATVDGAVQFEQILKAGDSRNITPGRDVYLQVGNAGAVKWAINGRTAKILGKPGETATARITRETLSKYVE